MSILNRLLLLSSMAASILSLASCMQCTLIGCTHAVTLNLSGPADESLESPSGFLVANGARLDFDCGAQPVASPNEGFLEAWCSETDDDFNGEGCGSCSTAMAGAVAE